MEKIEMLLNQILENQVRMQEDITELKGDVKRLDERVSSLEEMVSRLDERITFENELTRTELKQEIQNVCDTIKKVENDMNIVEMVTAKNWQDITALKAVVRPVA